MATVSLTADPQTLADAEAVVEALAAGKQPDSAVVRRIQERSAKTRDRVLREHGPLDIAVPAIREFRDS